MATAKRPAREVDDVACGAQRLAAQGLGQRLPDIVTATRHVVALQAQTWHGALLALANRVPGATVREVEALVASGELVVSWLNRGTLHLVHRDDFDWLHALTAPPKANVLQARLGRLGIDEFLADELIDHIVGHVASAGTATKDDISVHLTGLEINLDALTTAQLLETAAQRRLLVRGPMRNSDATYVLADAWVGAVPDLPDQFELVQRLVQRYCASHWPATPADLAAWSGLPVGVVKRAWAAAVPDDLEPPTTEPVTQLLGPFDPALHGWPDRRWILGDHIDRVITSNGIFKAFAVVDNRGVGTWKRVGDRVELDVFADADEDALTLLAADGERVARFLDGLG